MNNNTSSQTSLSREKLLEYILRDNKPKSKRKIEKFFSLNEKSKLELDKILHKLIKEKNILKIKKNFYSSAIPINKKIILVVTNIKNKQIFSTPLEFKTKLGSFEVFINKSNNYLLNSLGIGKKFYGSAHFDMNNNYKIKYITGIDSDNYNSVFGLLHYKNNKYFFQRDGVKSRFVEVISENKYKLEKGQLVKAQLIKYNKNKKAKIIEIIGNIRSVNELNKYIAKKNNLDLNFSDRVEKEAERVSNQEINTNDRKDLRNINFITIDPDDAMDHDDAIWASKDPDPSNKNGWLLKIAIADVSFYVKKDSPIDKEALNRCFSVYFPNSVIPMLPFNLSNNLCSLKHSHDRPAIVVDICIDSVGKILNYKFNKALINVSANLDYKEFNKFINNENEINKYNLLKQTINDLINSYSSLKKLKKTSPPLSVTSHDTKFNVKNNKVINASPTENLESHKLVEEFMIITNSCAADYIIKNEIKSLFRVHERPSEIKINQLKRTLKNLSIELHIDKKISTRSLNKLISLSQKTKYSNIINLAVLRCQSQANYSFKNIGHFGLSIKAYTHFTSPIRRYSDLIIHRSIINENNIEKNNITDDTLALQISELERNTMLIERNMQSIYSALYLSNKIGQIFDAYITSIKKFGVFINLKKFSIEGLVPKKKLGNNFFTFYPDEDLLLNKKTRETLRLGDNIKVKLVDTNILLGYLSFERII